MPSGRSRSSSRPAMFLMPRKKSAKCATEIFYHRIIGAVQPFIQQTVESGLLLADRVKGIIKEFIHHEHRSIGNISRPVLYMFHQCPDHLLCPDNFFQVIMRFRKKFPQPFFSAKSPCKIQFMENREFFLLRERSKCR